MSPKATGSATIYFRRVACPVRTYCAVDDPPKVAFTTLHRACGSRLKQELRCPKDNSLVAREDQAKGYEVAKDRFVMFEAGELEKLNPEPDPAIDVDDLVPLEDIDPVYWGRPCFLGPDAGAEKTYQLLVDTFRLEEKVAIGRWATRGRDLLVAIREYRGRLVLQEVRREDEVRDVLEIEVPPVTSDGLALDLALKVAEKMESDFDPDQPDVRFEAYAKAIAAKVAGQEIVISPPVDRPAQPLDIVEALKASMPDLASRKPAKKAPRESAPKSVDRRPARKAVR